jgi:hypothetical protein
MRLDVSWWDLDREAELAALRTDLDANGDDWREVPGLRWKAWLADHERGRWGAVMLWDPGRPPLGLLPPNRAAELIGRPPTVRGHFAVVRYLSREVPDA